VAVAVECTAQYARPKLKPTYPNIPNSNEPKRYSLEESQEKSQEESQEISGARSGSVGNGLT